MPPALGRHQEIRDRFFRSWKLVAQTFDRPPAGFGLTAVGGLEVTEARTCLTAGLEKEFGRDMETRTEALDMILVHLPLAAQNFRHNTRRSKDRNKVFLPQVVLVN